MNPRTKEVLVHIAYWVTIVAQLLNQILGNPS